MAIYRGTGGSGSSSTDSYASEISDYAQTAIDKAQEASDSASAAALSADEANDSATLSASSATDADNAKLAAQAARDAAQTSEDNAGFSSDDAQKLAINPEDSQFTLSDGVTTGYSALHHKEKAIDAQASAESARDTALTYSDNALSYRNTTLGYRDAAEGYAATATTQASTATTQAEAAATQATTATTQAGIATTKAGEAATSETNAATSATAAATAYDNFDDRYLGSKPSDPTLDNDGDALLTGALYFNSTDDVMKVYDGASWVAAYASIAGITLNDVTNDGNTTTNTITVGGLTSTGAVILNADPSSNLGAATKQYVDTIAAAGIHYHDPVRVEQEGNLTATYDNGSSGVGATLTNSSTQEALVIDGVTLSAGDRVLIYEQTNQAQNGIYTVTDVGSGSTNWVLTRAVDADSYAPSDPDSFGQGDAFYVQEGSLGAGETYVMTTEGSITFGTTNIHFSQISSAQVYSGSTGIDITGTTISSTATLADVTTAGNSTTNSITVGGITSTGNVTASNLNTNDWDTAYGWGNHASAGYYVNGATGFSSTGIDDNATSTAVTLGVSGNVGIGVTNPTNGKLCVDGSINITTTSGTYAAGALGFTDSNFGFLHRPPRVGAVAAHAFQSFAGSTLMAVTDGGNVGIGTVPSDANQSYVSGAYTEAIIQGNSANKIGSLQLRSAGTANVTHFELAAADGLAASYIWNGTASDMVFGTNNSERMRIDASGNVGINNPSPTYTLDVTNNSSAYAPSARFLSNSDAANWARVDIENVNAGVPFILYQDNGGAVGVRNEAAAPLLFSTDAQERVRIDSSGELLVGLSSSTDFSGKVVISDGAVGGSTFLDICNGANKQQFIKLGINSNTAMLGFDDNDSFAIGRFTDASQTTFQDQFLTVLNDGNVGIGNSPTDARVFIEGANNQGAPSTSIDSTLTLMTGTGGVGSGGELRFAALGNSKGQAAIKSYATDGGGNSQGYLDFYIRPNINDTSMTLGMRLGHQGDLVVTRNVTAYSDERLKDNIETLDGSKVYEMRGVSFTKDGEAGSGVIAQELQKIAPELVHEGEEYLSVAYGNLVGYLIEAVKELKAEIDELKGAK